MFTVITRVPNPHKGEGGNLYNNFYEVFYEVEAPSKENDYMGRYACISEHPVLRSYVLELTGPVFMLGEILWLNENGRDVFGRKPSKWDVDTEVFDSYDKAYTRAKELLNAE